MNSPTNPSPKNIRAYLRIDFWSIIMGIALLIIGLMLYFNVKGAILWGILITWGLGIIAQFRGHYALGRQRWD